MVIFQNRMNRQPAKDEPRYPTPDPEAYHDARLVAPGYDVYDLERQWRDWWVDRGMPELNFPAQVFIPFFATRHQ